MNDALLNIRCGVIAPTYDNGRTVGGVLRGLSGLGLPVIAVDDGSRDETAAELARWQTAGGADDQRIVLTHARNRGKAAALQTGFDHAASLGWTHVVTIDTDGQLDAEDAPKLIAAAAMYPQRIICGVRDAASSGMGGRSRLGRGLSNRLVAWNSGVRTADSQCGLRAYPLALIRSLNIHEQGYEFEAACLVRSGWAGLETFDVDVRCTYDVAGGRVSHFRVIRDTSRAAWMHGRLLMISMLPWLRRRHGDLAPVSVCRSGDRGLLGEVVSVGSGTMFMRFARWLDPRPAWRAVRRGPVGRRRFASALAVGALIANLPIFGVQSVVSLLAARWLGLPPVAVVAGSQLSTPPLGPVLVMAAIGVGSRIRDGAWPTLGDFDPRVHGWLNIFQTLLIEWTIGGVIVGVCCAVVVFVVASVILARVQAPQA